MGILETQVSYYKNIRDINTNQTATIGSILRSIECGGKNGAIANQIHQIRTEQDKERRSQLKKGLPVIMWQGIFNCRGKSGLKSLSGALCIDIDHKSEDELLMLKSTLTTVPWVLAFFRSPSGDGLKVLVKASVKTPQEYENCYAQLIDVFRNTFECEVDESCKEYSKACYTSYDPDIYVNPDALDYHFSYDPTYDKQSSMKCRKSNDIGGQYQVCAPTSQESFINKLNIQSQNLSDEDILNILDRKFHRYPKNYQEGNRRDAIYRQAIVLCKAGIPKTKTTDYLFSQYHPLHFSMDELEFEVDKAYIHHQLVYGTERGQYQNYETYRKTHSQKL